MTARASLALCLLGCFFGCTQILNLPSGSGDFSAFKRTCECTPLKLQGPDFQAACSEGFDATNAAAESGDTTAKDQLFALANLGCADCANVSVCYGAIVGAADDGGACETSLDCASWACCGGQVQVAYIATDKTLEAQADSPPVCCPSVDSSTPACDDCETALNALLARQQTAVTCNDSITLLDAVLQCFVANADLCDPECKFPAVKSNPIGCVQCELDAGACGEKMTDCANDHARPVASGGG